MATLQYLRQDQKHYQKGVLSTFDKGEAVCALLLDISKAFDCMDRGILLKKLECYGIRGKMFLLLKSGKINFWKNINFDVKIDKTIVYKVDN